MIVRLNFNPETTDILDFGETLEDLCDGEGPPPEFLARDDEPGWEYDWDPDRPRDHSGQPSWNPNAGDDGDEHWWDPEPLGDAHGGRRAYTWAGLRLGDDNGDGRAYTWGGRRPGAGAPTGNLNALQHGRNSPRLLGYIRALASDPTMQRVIGELMRVTGRGSDTELVKKALKGVRLTESKHDDIRRRQRRHRARAFRHVQRLLAQLPPDYDFVEPPPVLPLDHSGRPTVHSNETGAPFNPITGRFEPIHPMVPASITRAYRRVHRALRRKHQDDLIQWFKDEFMDPPLE